MGHMPITARHHHGAETRCGRVGTSQRRSRLESLMVASRGVQYATSPDGTSIGFQRFGDGPPVLRTPALMGALRLNEVVDSRANDASAALPGRSIVRYDRRGTGYSDRSVTDFSMEAAMGDLGSVMDAVSPEPVVIGATWDHGPVAMRYAAQFPQRVSHLILETTFIRGVDLLSTTSTRFAVSILHEDWDYFLRVIARVEVSLDRPQSDMFEAIAREEMSHHVMRSWFTAIRDYDATEWLDAIKAPTLIVQRTRTSIDEPAHGYLRELAARIPGATLVRGDGAKRREAIAEFIGVSVRSERPGPFRTVMFADLVASTAHTERVGDEEAQRTLETHDAVVRKALSSHEGIEVKHTGDGIMAAFDSAADAVRAATAILSRLGRESVSVRIGLNAGEPIVRDGDLHGTSVNLAARVCDAAESGQALATGVVRDLTAGKGVRWQSGHTIELKGFEHLVTVFVLESS